MVGRTYRSAVAAVMLPSAALSCCCSPTPPCSDDSVNSTTGQEATTLSRVRNPAGCLSARLLARPVPRTTPSDGVACFLRSRRCPCGRKCQWCRR
eukprot:140711-Prorocentrum_minimum.AAC.2